MTHAALLFGLGALGITLLVAAGLAVRQTRRERAAAAHIRELKHDRAELARVGKQLALVEPGWAAQHSESQVLRDLLLELVALRATSDISRDRLVIRELGGAWVRSYGAWTWNANEGSKLAHGDVLASVDEVEIEGGDSGGALWGRFYNVHGCLAADLVVVRRGSSWVSVDLHDGHVEKS